MSQFMCAAEKWQKHLHNRKGRKKHKSASTAPVEDGLEKTQELLKRYHDELGEARATIARLEQEIADLNERLRGKIKTLEDRDLSAAMRENQFAGVAGWKGRP